MATVDLMLLLEEIVDGGSPFRLDYGQETSGQASGQIRVRDLRDPLWRVRFTASAVPRALAAEIAALVEAMGGSVGSFLAWPPEALSPAGDPDGSLLGSATVSIRSLGADNRSLSLAGLPSGYVLQRGDFLSFGYGTGRTALHRVTAARATADADGDTALFDVAPPLRSGVAPGAAVTLVRPAAEMRIVPGSYDPAHAETMGSLSLDLIQVV